MPYYMVDSTYTVASDPNTMRDSGPTRNSIYFAKDKAAESEFRKSKAMLMGENAAKFL
jgi:hypothetical protein